MSLCGSTGRSDVLEPFYSEGEAAKLLGITPGQLRGLREARKIRCERRERGRPRIVYSDAHLDAYRKGNR